MNKVVYIGLGAVALYFGYKYITDKNKTVKSKDQLVKKDLPSEGLTLSNNVPQRGSGTVPQGAVAFDGLNIQTDNQRNVSFCCNGVRYQIPYGVAQLLKQHGKAIGKCK